MKTTRLIGTMCKWSDPFSKRVLIGRGLDPILIRYSVCRSSIFSFEGTSSKREADDKVICMAGVDDGEVPPVPIPNTEVKLTCAEDSWLETACENR